MGSVVEDVVCCIDCLVFCCYFEDGVLMLGLFFVVFDFMCVFEVVVLIVVEFG